MAILSEAFRFFSVSLLSISLLLLLSVPAEAEDPVDGVSLLKTFSTSSNSVERRTILSSLNDITVQEGEMAPQWVSDLLGIAIKDKSPVVVAFAARQIGRFILQEYNADLVALFGPPGLQLQRIKSLPLDPFYHALLSEVSWSTGVTAGIKALRGALLGALSFLAGLKPGCGSSTLYIFSKT